MPSFRKEMANLMCKIKEAKDRDSNASGEVDPGLFKNLHGFFLREKKIVIHFMQKV
jgi:hypothetical protein